MAMPMVIIPAHSLGKTGYESAAELDQDKEFFSGLNQYVSKQARQWGLAMSRTW